MSLLVLTDTATCLGPLSRHWSHLVPSPDLLPGRLTNTRMVMLITYPKKQAYQTLSEYVSLILNASIPPFRQLFWTISIFFNSFLSVPLDSAHLYCASALLVLIRQEWVTDLGSVPWLHRKHQCSTAKLNTGICLSALFVSRWLCTRMSPCVNDHVLTCKCLFGNLSKICLFCRDADRRTTIMLILCTLIICVMYTFY